MTQTEIIEMARQSGMVYREFEDEFANANTDGVDLKTIVAFAKLVAAKERESLRESFRVVTAAEASAAILHEREACAKVCDDLDKSHWGCEVRASWCSEAIRARGEA